MYQINKLVYGIDLIEEQLYATMGTPRVPSVPATPYHHIAEYSVNCKKTGTIKHLDFLEVCTACH